MPDSRHHRGPHPEDARLFGSAESQRLLRLAAGDLAWLLGRHYAPQAALTLVGNRYQLHQRQRHALSRAVAAPAVAQARRARQVGPEALTGASLQVDALNQLITIEVALAGGVLLRGHDGALRDLASVHGTYRTVEETTLALQALGMWLAPLGVKEVAFFIDAQVSNSGRLASIMRTLAAAHGWPWQATLVPSADTVLRQTPEIVATSDSSILDQAGHWFGLAAAVVHCVAPHAWYIDLDVPPSTVCL
jgi:hypothetical protein